MYSPLALMVPPVALQVTAVLLVPVTVAVNCCVAPVASDAVAGVTDTAIAVEVDWFADDVEPVVPHPARVIRTAAQIVSRAACFTKYPRNSCPRAKPHTGSAQVLPYG